MKYLILFVTLNGLVANANIGESNVDLGTPCKKSWALDEKLFGDYQVTFELHHRVLLDLGSYISHPYNAVNSWTNYWGNPPAFDIFTDTVSTGEYVNEIPAGQVLRVASVRYSPRDAVIKGMLHIKFEHEYAIDEEKKRQQQAEGYDLPSLYTTEIPGVNAMNIWSTYPITIRRFEKIFTATVYCKEKH